MTCHHVTIGGLMAIVCTRSPRRRRCQELGRDAAATKQCDFPLDRVRFPRGSKSKTCDRWLCVGKRAAGRLLDGREWSEFPV